MRVGVIRGDIPGPIFLADFEPTSQTNFPTEPEGQTRYISRPTSVTVGAMLSADIPASIAGGVAVTFPLNIILGNETLKLRNDLGSYTSYLVPIAAYASMTALLAAVNSVLAGSPFVAVEQSPGSNIFAIQTTAKGAGTYIQVDSVAGGSTFNTPSALAVGGASKTVPAAATFITATLPVGGPLDVSHATIRGSLGSGLTDAQVKAAADAIAPQFVETDVAIKSFLVGDLAALRSASFNPDPNRLPAITPGAAITVVQDDGVSLFVSTKPTITNAQFNVPAPGAVTITGTGLASFGSPNAEDLLTKVKFVLPTVSTGYVSIDQYTIQSAVGGKVSATQIVIPASLVPAGVAVGTKVQVQYTSFASNQFTLV